MKKPADPVREDPVPYGAAGSTVSSKGQITIPKSVRDRYEFAPGCEVEFEYREDGALLRRKRSPRHPIWGVMGSFRRNWPRGIPYETDAYIDLVRGGPYERAVRPRRGKARRKA